MGEFNFEYYDRSTESGYSAGYNSWKMRTTETLPDGNENIVYTNDYGQVMLEVFHDTSTDQKWATFYHFDAEGRVTFRAEPSAVNGYDDTKADLLELVSGNYVYLNDTTGLITDYAYYPKTGVPTGGAPGYVSDISIRNGETATIAAGTKIPQSHTTYTTHTDAGGATIYLPATETVYAGLDSAGPLTTTFTYTYSGTQVASKAATDPAGGTTTVVFDSYGRPTWSQDADDFVHFTQYDQLTGAVVATIGDVETSLVTNEPSGWTTPTGGGGAHAVTTVEVDGLGRPTKTTDANGNVTYTVYKDASHEIRIYPGWNATTNAPTGPTVVVRDDRAQGYVEKLTMSATPSVTSGRPNGTEAIASLQSLSRTIYSLAGQVLQTVDYFNLTGLTYSTAGFGSPNVHFYNSTIQDYDNRGRPHRMVRVDGTIYRTVFDDLGRPISEWIGTNDTPTSGSWSPTNPAGMTRVQSYTYTTAAASATAC